MVDTAFTCDAATGAITGSYNIGIYDASGRKIVETGSVAFTGANSTMQNRSEVITATTFEAGNYYVVIGVDSTGVGARGYFNFLVRRNGQVVQFAGQRVRVVAAA